MLPLSLRPLLDVHARIKRPNTFCKGWKALLATTCTITFTFYVGRTYVTCAQGENDDQNGDLDGVYFHCHQVNTKKNTKNGKWVNEYNSTMNIVLYDVGLGNELFKKQPKLRINTREKACVKAQGRLSCLKSSPNSR